MKKIALVFVAAAFMAAPVLANNSMDSTNPVTVLVDQDKVKKDKEEVKISDLPTNITAALRGQEYAGWEAKEAWKMKTDEGWVYKVKLMKGDETKKVKFTKEGKALVS